MRASGKHAEDVTALVRDHAHTTLRRAWPAFAVAASTARRDPLELSIAATEAGVRVVSFTKGALQVALGERLKKLGLVLTQGRNEAI